MTYTTYVPRAYKGTSIPIYNVHKNSLTKNMPSKNKRKMATSSKEESKGRKTPKRHRTDVEIQAYYAKGVVVPKLTSIRTPLGRYASYVHVDFYPTGLLTDVPEEDAPESVWDEDVHLKVPDDANGSNSAMVVPVHCDDISLEDLRSLPRAEQLRCIWDGAHGTWVHCARRAVDGFDSEGGMLRCKYIGNMVPFAPEGVSPNCRIVLDWDWTEDKPMRERCMLVSSHKMERGFEWRLDKDFMQRQLEDGLAEDESEYESDLGNASTVPKEGVVTRSQVSAADASSTQDFQERVVHALETHSMEMSSLAALLREHNELSRERNAQEMEQSAHARTVSACMQRVVQMVDVLGSRHCQSMDHHTQLLSRLLGRGEAVVPAGPTQGAEEIKDVS